MILALLILSLLASPALAETCAEIPRLSADIASQDYNYSGVKFVLDKQSSKTVCGYWFKDKADPNVSPTLTTSSKFSHKVKVTIPGKNPYQTSGTETSQPLPFKEDGRFTVVVSDMVDKGDVSIRLNFPPQYASTCLEKMEGTSKGATGIGGFTIRMPKGAPNPNQPKTSNDSFSAGWAPLPMGEYIFELKRVEEGICNDRNNINLKVRSDNKKSAQPQEARTPPEAILKCSDPSAVRIPWNNYARSKGIDDLYGYWGNASAPIGRDWSKFCFWVDKPDVKEINFSVLQFGSSQCAKYKMRMIPPACSTSVGGGAVGGGTVGVSGGGSGGGSGTWTGLGTYPYTTPKEKKCGGEEPFTMTWSAEGPTYTPSPSDTATPIPNATVIPTPTGNGTDTTISGNVGLDKEVLFSYQNLKNVKRLDFEVVGNGITMTVLPPSTTLWAPQTPFKLVHLGTTDADSYARVPKGVYGIKVFGPNSSGSGDACTPPLPGNWKLIKSGQTEGAAAEGSALFRFRLAKKATSLSFAITADSLGVTTFYRGRKEIFSTSLGKASLADLGGEPGVYYVSSYSSGNYKIKYSAYDNDGVIPDSQPEVCAGGPALGNFTLKIQPGAVGSLPPPSPTPSPSPKPTRTPASTPTPTAKPPGIFTGDNFRKDNLTSFGKSERLAAILIDKYPENATEDIIPRWADIAVILYRGSQDNQTLYNISSDTFFEILARQPYAKIAPSISSDSIYSLRNFYSMFPAEMWAQINGSPVGQGDLTTGINLYKKSFKGAALPVPLPEKVKFFKSTEASEALKWKGKTNRAEITNIFVPQGSSQEAAVVVPGALWARVRVKNTGTSPWVPPSDYYLQNQRTSEKTTLPKIIYPGGEQEFIVPIKFYGEYEWAMFYKEDQISAVSRYYYLDPNYTSVLSSTPTPVPTPTATPYTYIPFTPTPTPTPVCPPGYRPMPPPYGIAGRCYPF